MICPVGVGFQSPGPTGVVGIAITAGKPSCAAFCTASLGKPFGPLVVADHFIQRRIRVFVWQRLSIHRYSCHRARVDEPLHARMHRGSQQILRAAYVAVVNFLWVGAPETVVRGNMKNAVDPVQCGC